MKTSLFTKLKIIIRSTSNPNEKVKNLFQISWQQHGKNKFVPIFVLKIFLIFQSKPTR